MDKAHAYVENWKEAYKSNIGLLLFGDVGTGKSFFAGCIANALLDQDVPVLMTNFPTILNRLTGMFSEDRSEFIASFDEYNLLIIDDLGVERSTEYAMEQMFFVIDSRYRSRRPMIITTNLKLSELKNPPDLAHARIYDRILERCAPILFDGKNFREENASATRQTAKDIVNSKSLILCRRRRYKRLFRPCEPWKALEAIVDVRNQRQKAYQYYICNAKSRGCRNRISRGRHTTGWNYFALTLKCGIE